jgi:hypothetical protein
MNPPPGDWSNTLPNGCCSGDPPPTVKGIVVWDSATGKVTRFAVSEFAWSSPDVGWSEDDRLVWSKDGSALFYSTHPTQDRTTLHRLSLDGQVTPLVEIGVRVGLEVVAQGNDGSIYFIMVGMGCQNCAELTRRLPDGRLEVIRPNSVPLDWHVDRQGRLETLKDGGIAITDLTTGRSSQVNFPGVQISSSEIAWPAINGLVPISPDGRWVAYAGSQSDAVVIGPDGRPDRGRTVHITRVK